MLTHTVIVLEHPNNTLATDKALSFCENIVAQGDEVKQIFFMHDAVFTAVHEVASVWQSFAIKHQVELQTCISTAEHKNISIEDYLEGFLQGGLSMLADSLLSSDVIHNIDDRCDGELSYSVASDLDSNRKKINIVFNSTPHENSVAAEGVDLLLVLSAFDAELSVFFEGDGVENILTLDESIKCQPSLPRYVKRFKAFSDFEIEKVYVVTDEQSESASYEIPVKVLTAHKFQQLASSVRTLRF